MDGWMDVLRDIELKNVDVALKIHIVKGYGKKSMQAFQTSDTIFSLQWVAIPSQDTSSSRPAAAAEVISVHFTCPQDARIAAAQHFLFVWVSAVTNGMSPPGPDQTAGHNYCVFPGTSPSFQGEVSSVRLTDSHQPCSYPLFSHSKQSACVCMWNQTRHTRHLSTVAEVCVKPRWLWHTGGFSALKHLACIIHESRGCLVGTLLWHGADSTGAK